MMSGGGFEAGAQIKGYLVRKVIEIHEIGSVAYELEHMATGARHLHIANNDIENAFSVAFKTVPGDSTGVAHILEHTVLCGSQKYPVRDPFFSMIKRSVSSFMNALTASDWTSYPFATPNRKDFYNLLDVYLDAVFFPVLSEASFRQEGCRLGIAGEDGNGEVELAYKGVVYNEMKGAMSSPDQVMFRSLLKALYPDTVYSNNSGGDPADIPSLTFEDLREFHRRHYHPGNAYFYTYGNIPLPDHLEFIGERVLSRFGKKTDPAMDIPSQPRWKSPKSVSYPYPLARGEDPSKKYQACVAWLMADTREKFDVFVIGLLEQVLLGNPSAPLYKALIGSGLGSALSDGTGYDPEMKDTMFACGLKDVGKDDTAAVERIILDTLRGLSTNGIDRELIDAAIHQIEFHRREITNTPYPYGVKLFLSVCGSWLHGSDPVDIIQIDPYLDRLYEELEKGPFLEECIRRFFLDNPHRLTFTLVPDPEMEERENAKIKERLMKIKASLGPSDIERIKRQERELESLQMKQEDLSVLPTLEISDIGHDVQKVDRPATYGNVACYDQRTSGIFYFTSAVGTGMLDPGLVPLVPFFCIAVPRMGTDIHDYTAMDRLIDMHTGGLGLSAHARTNLAGDSVCVPYISFSAKCLERKIGPMFDIVGELLCHCNFSDHQRLGQLLGEYRASLESSVVHNGHRFALSLASRHLSAATRLSETWHGIHQLRYIKEITDDLTPGRLASVADRLSRIARAVFARGNMKTGLIGGAKALAGAVDIVKSIEARLGPSQGPDGFSVDHGKTELTPPREGWWTSTAVSFVARAFPAVRMGHPDAPVLAVISKLLRSSFLHREIRERGGAYGGLALYNSEDGVFCFASYRDPHIVNTLDVYEKAVDYLRSGDYTDQQIKESVIQVCSDIDKPDTPAEAATKAFYRGLVGVSDEERVRFKRGVLEVNKDRVLKTANKHFHKKCGQCGTVVISSEDMLKKANTRLTTPLDLFRI